MVARRIERPRPRASASPPPLRQTVAEEMGLAGTIEKLERGEVDPRSVSTSERRALLMLQGPGRSQVALAGLFGVSRACIQKDMKAIRKEAAKARSSVVSSFRPSRSPRARSRRTTWPRRGRSTASWSSS